MKRIITVLIAIAIIIATIPLVGFISPEKQIKVRTIDPNIYTFNIEDVPEHLRERVLNLREQKNNFQGIHKIKLLAMGLTEQEISNLTVGQAADWLNGGTVIYPEYIENYLNTEDLAEELENTFKAYYHKYKEFGLNDTEIIALYDLGVNPFVYDSDSIEMSGTLQSPKEKMLEILNQHQASIEKEAYTSTRAGVHVVRGQTFEDFIRSSYDSSSTTQEYFAEPAFTTAYGLNPTPGTQNYTLKHNHIADCLESVRSYVKLLYNTNNTQNYRYNYYLWAEDNGINGKYHQGLDTYSIYTARANLYSPITGCVDYVGTASNGATVLRIFDIVSLDYFNFLHLDISSTIESAYAMGNPTDLFQGDFIGNESNYGASGAHTHIEIKSSSSGPSNESTTIYSERVYDYF